MGHARGWTILLWALALTLPVGALVQPWLFPSRSDMPAVSRRLNAPVILITVAGLRADHLGHLGYERETSPALDRVAELGTSFVSFYANSNDGVATTASVVSGHCPPFHQVGGEREQLPESIMTLGERFTAQGYHTGAVLANADHVDRNFAQGFGQVARLPDAGADEALARALQLLDDFPSNRSLLWVDLGDLAAPYGGPQLELSRFAPDAPAGFGGSLEDYDLDEAELAARGWGERELGWMTARYDAALAELDAALGRFFDALDEANRIETTMLCVLGTRGERLAERGAPYFTHAADLYEQSIRVPFLVRLPARFVRGLTLRRLGQSVDVGPTIAELGGRFAWEGGVGTSLATAIRQQQAPNKLIYSEGRVRSADDPDGWHGLVVRLSDYKLITDRGGSRREAYRPLEDPHEQRPFSLVPLQAQEIIKRAEPWLTNCAP